MTYKAGWNESFSKVYPLRNGTFQFAFLLAKLHRCAIIETFFVYKIFTLNL